MLISCVPIIAHAETSGICGENVTWTLDDNGTLTISGTGDMENWYSPEVPWYSNCSDIKTVLISHGVTSIGKYAFSGCNGLTSVTIPNSVTSIGGSAFSGCSGLTSVTIPNSVTSIGGSAFSDCSGLTSITIPDRVTSIGYWTFSGCSSLTSVTIPNSITCIGNYAFSGCSALTSITIPESITSIDYCTFDKCTSLKDIYYSGTVAQCNNISIGSSNDILKTAAIHCSDGTKNGPQITSEGFTIDSGCGEIISYDATLEGVCNIPDKIEDITITNIGNNAFKDCAGITEINIPASVRGITATAFIGCDNLSAVNVDEANQSYSSENGILFGNNRTVFMLYPAAKAQTTLYRVPDGVTTIVSNAFCGKQLNEIDLPDSVTEIKTQAFNDCNVSSINLGNGNINIEARAIYCCENLNNITIPENAVFDSGAIMYCPYLMNVYYGGSKEVYPADRGFVHKGYYKKSHDVHCYTASGSCGDNLTWTVYDESVLKISGSGSMEEYSSSEETPWYEYSEALNEIVIDAGVESIGQYAFDSLNNVSIVYYNNGESEWNKLSVGENNDVLQNAKIYYIGMYGLAGTGALSNYGGYDGIIWEVRGTTLYFSGSGAMCIFGNESTCPSHDSPWYEYRDVIDTVQIDSDITSLGWRAFLDFSQIEHVDIPIGTKYFHFDDYMGAFNNCSSLKSITIPTTISSIGTDGIDTCTSLEDIYYEGSEEEWNNIKISGDGIPANVTIHYNYSRYDESGYEITNVTNADNKITVDVSSTESTTVSAKLIAAVYDDNGTFVTLREKNIFPEAETQTYEIDFGDIDSSNAKVFIWNSLKGMIPLADMG